MLSEEPMRPPRALTLLSPVLTVALVAAVAPFVSWRKAPPAARTAEAVALPETISFNEHIRPIFVRNCFRCHGSDPGSRKAELRLDRPEFAFAPRKNGQPVIVKGNPGQSALVRRIKSTDPDVVMPPPETHKTLEPREKALFERWIKDGAEYQPHWALIKPERPTPPDVRQADRARNPIDRFVLARLEEEGLTPNPEADRHTLVRRVTLDLTGLPPTPQEVEAFVRDESPKAYEALVDRLLARPSYGEHRARYWLDSVRYADTHGYHFDNYRSIWPYRDWVIHAFNANQPFDQFTQEQIAGDMLPKATQDQRIATGYIRAGMSTNEGGTIPEENLAIYATDRVETTSQVWLGLTLGCARCHDHKFDPISTKDFYSMAAFFRNTTQPAMDKNVMDSPPILRMPRAEDAKRYAALPGEIDAAKKAYGSHVEAAESAFETWQQTQGPADLPTIGDERLDFRLLSDPADPTTLRNVTASTDRAFTFTGGKPLVVTSPQGPAVRLPKGVTADLGDLGDVESDEPFSYGAWVQVTDTVDGALLARMDIANGYRGWDLWMKGSRAGAQIISSWNQDALRVLAQNAVSSEGWHHVFVTYDGSRKASGVKVYYDGKAQDVFEEVDSLRGSIRTKTPLRVNRRSTGEGAEGTSIYDIRFYRSALSAPEVQVLANRVTLESALAARPTERTKEQLKPLRDYYLAFIDADAMRLRDARDALVGEFEAVKARAKVTLIAEEKKGQEPFAHILIRGQYDQEGDKVKAAVPAALPPLPEGAPANRLGLARWLTHPDHPLTARVNVNRFWAQVFGQGLVPTAGEFGTTGEPPTNPKLLDWLAVEFRESGWDVKALFRLMVTSATYRQSAAATPEKLEKDPDNRLLSRGPRFRMHGEMIRDLALVASGELSPKIGGPSVKPYQPPGIWEVVAMEESNTKIYVPDQGQANYRRSLYTFWKRAAPPPAMETFNAPTREQCAVDRERTNTPLQALVTLNDVQFIEASRHLAEIAIHEGGENDVGRLDAIALRVLARPLETAERNALGPVIHDLRDHYVRDPKASRALVAVGESPPSASIPAPELAAWTMVASQFFNLDEALNK
jgi:mono/diheme cytochrome c family protein